MTCPYLEDCAFMKHCKQEKVSVSVDGLVYIYCKGTKQEACARKRLLERFSRQIVPIDMMPNGFPLPGANTNAWKKEAKEINH